MLVEENINWQLECGQIRQRGARLLASAQWADCCFLLGQDKAPHKAHRLLLAIASPVFQAMFYGPLAERDAPIPLPDIQLEVFMQLLQYIYTDQIDLKDHAIAIELYFAAQKYMLKYLQELCTAYLSGNLSPTNACRIYEFAYSIGDKKLKCNSLKVIKAETKLALSDNSFEHLSLATVISIFSMDDITIDSELDLFKAAERYYLANQESLDERSTASTHSLVQSENDPKKDPCENNNSVTEDHNQESYIPHDNDNTQNEQEKESAKMQQMLSSSDLPLACVDTENEDDRARSEATFRFTVQNVTNLPKTGVFSPPCYVRELPWRISVAYFIFKGQKYLFGYLLCDNNSKSISWSCQVTYQLALVNHDWPPYSDPLVNQQQIKHLFCKKNISSGALNFFLDRSKNKLEFVLDTNNGFLKDDSITVVAHVIAEEPEGIPLSMKKLSEMKDVSIQTLIKQIRFLTLNPKELADYKPTSSLLTEHDIHALIMKLISTETYVALPKVFSRCRRARKPEMQKK